MHWSKMLSSNPADHNMDNTAAFNSGYGQPAAINDISLNLMLLQKIRALQQQPNRFNFNNNYNSNLQLHTGGQDNMVTSNSLFNQVKLGDVRSYGNLYNSNKNINLNTISHYNDRITNNKDSGVHKYSLLDNSSNNLMHYNNFNNYKLSSSFNNINDYEIDNEEVALEEEEEEEDEFNEDLRNNNETKKEKKRSKRRLSEAQVARLEASWFEAGGHLGAVGRRLEAQQKIQLAQSLGLHPRQVAIWFQNRRARWKTKHLQHQYNLLKTQYNSMVAETNTLKVEVERLTMELEQKGSSQGGITASHDSTSLKLMTLPPDNLKSNEDILERKNIGSVHQPEAQSILEHELITNVDDNGSSNSQLSCLAQELIGDNTCIGSSIHATMQQPTITQLPNNIQSSIASNNLPNDNASFFQVDRETNLHLSMDWLWELNTYVS